RAARGRQAPARPDRARQAAGQRARRRHLRRGASRTLRTRPAGRRCRCGRGTSGDRRPGSPWVARDERSCEEPLSGAIRVGTRGSLLATTQAGAIRDALNAKGHAAELVIITTEGDRSAEPIATIGVGVFTAALRAAIAEGRVDMAVHSYKDL